MPSADLNAAAPSHYIVGIDLGTTNSAMAYVDTQAQVRKVETFRIPQVVAPGQIEARETLPSFHYQPASGELAAGALRLPWEKTESNLCVGVCAREHGMQVPGRQIASAKSWLCHAGVDRTADLLPWHGAEEVSKLSPVAASAQYLAHMRAAWDHRFPVAPLAEQDLVLTLPASFDEIARELTVQAASRAGLKRVMLIEEPQAAFYAWLHRHTDNWESLVAPGSKILVCDIGGGTSDFTLIRARSSESGQVQFHRVAVGEHLILGGDNLDLALARHVEGRLTPGGKLPTRAWDVLVANCRRVKETLLGEHSPETYTISLPGLGSKLIGGSQQVEITRDEVQRVLVDGFLPRVDLEDKPQRRASGFQEFGLPYATDAAITRYLASFLTAHRRAGLDEDTQLPHDPARPDFVLFNGGFFASHVLRERLLSVLTGWFRNTSEFDQAEQSWAPQVLENQRLDLAVAHGAAYYGLVRRGEGVRIAADLARTYYVGVAGEENQALCLVPASAEPGSTIELADHKFDLLVSEPVEFPLYVSSTRLTDRPGSLVPIDPEQLKALPPIRTVLKAKPRDVADRLTVTLAGRLTEIGTLELGCREVDGTRTWRLQFDVRSATRTDLLAHTGTGERQGFVDEETWQACRKLLEETFGPQANPKPGGLMRSLSAVLEMPRDEWPMPLLRRIWEMLLELEPGRRKSPAHEARWLNLLGFSLRPGFGLAVDDWRVAETWRAVQGKLAFGAAGSQSEAQILWRRIAGGLSAGQQRAIADPVLAPLRALHRKTTTGQGRAGEVSSKPEETAEAWRLLASLELLPAGVKQEIGQTLIDLLPRRKMQPVRASLVWALGRLAARVPVYGPINTVVAAAVVQAWLQEFLPLAEANSADPLAIMQMARRTDDRYRDLSEKASRSALDWLSENNAPAHLIELVRDGGSLDVDEQGQVFGESLPRGLRIV
jgi:molecular chaperone DnaK (HSP70)